MSNKKPIPRLDGYRSFSGLDEEFKVFKDNLGNSNIVVAFPGAFFLIGEHSVMHGQPAAYMAIPLYVYIVIKVRASKGIHFESWQKTTRGEGFEKFEW